MRILALFFATLLAGIGPVRAEQAVVIPPPALDSAAKSGLETIVLAGGCFWGLQGVFQHVKGVKNAVSGYAGGTAKSAKYRIVSSGYTGHAESVQVTFDPKIISLGGILQIYFSVAHNPTQLNYQGPDHGTQYRSNIFYASQEQKKIAEAYIRQLSETGVFGKPIVTRVDPLEKFYAAEDYHQDYMTRHPRQPYIVFNDLPKVKNLEKLFPARYRSKPALVRKG